MIKKLTNKIICRAKGHQLVEAGACPYTQIQYKACTRCNILLDASKLNEVKWLLWS